MISGCQKAALIINTFRVVRPMKLKFASFPVQKYGMVDGAVDMSAPTRWPITSAIT